MGLAASFPREAWRMVLRDPEYHPYVLISCISAAGYGATSIT